MYNHFSHTLYTLSQYTAMYNEREPLLVCGRAYLVYTARCLNIFGYYINSILTHVALDTYFLLSLATKRKCTCTQ